VLNASGGEGGWTIAPTGGAATVSYVSGEYSDTFILTTSRAILPVGTETLTLSYVQPGNGVEDSAGNELVSLGPVAVTNNSAASAPSTTAYTLFGDDAPSGTSAGSGNAVTLGVRFTTSAYVLATHVKFYKAVAMDGQTHTGAIWEDTGRLLGQIEFTGESGSGWQTMALSPAIPLHPGQTYLSTVHVGDGDWIYKSDSFGSAWNNPPLSAPATTGGAPNGAYVYGDNLAFPTSGGGKNYQIDLVIRKAEVGLGCTIN